MERGEIEICIYILLNSFRLKMYCKFLFLHIRIHRHNYISRFASIDHLASGNWGFGLWFCFKLWILWFIDIFSCYSVIRIWSLDMLPRQTSFILLACWVCSAWVIIICFFIQLCVWSTDGWEKQTTRQLQIPAGRAAAPLADTRVQFHQDQTHLIAVNETQIAIYEAPKLECLKQVRI